MCICQLQPHITPDVLTSLMLPRYDPDAGEQYFWQCQELPKPPYKYAPKNSVHISNYEQCGAWLRSCKSAETNVSAHMQKLICRADAHRLLQVERPTAKGISCCHLASGKGHPAQMLSSALRKIRHTPSVCPPSFCRLVCMAVFSEMQCWFPRHAPPSSHLCACCQVYQTLLPAANFLEPCRCAEQRTDRASIC